MNSGTGLIAPLVQSFFTDHLVLDAYYRLGNTCASVPTLTSIVPASTPFSRLTDLP